MPIKQEYLKAIQEYPQRIEQKNAQDTATALKAAQKQVDADNALLAKNELRLLEFRKWIDALGLKAGMEALSQLVHGGNVQNSGLGFSFVTKSREGQIVTGWKQGKKTGEELIEVGRGEWGTGGSYWQTYYEQIPILKPPEILTDTFSILVSEANSFSGGGDGNYFNFEPKLHWHSKVHGGLKVEDFPDVFGHGDFRWKIPSRINLYRNSNMDSQISQLQDLLGRCHQNLIQLYIE